MFPLVIELNVTWYCVILFSRIVKKKLKLFVEFKEERERGWVDESKE